MKYVSVAEKAAAWGLSERSVRRYCADGRVRGAFLTGKTWNIPEDAEKPVRVARGGALLTVLKEEKAAKLSGGIYHRLQIDLTYNSNHMEGSRLTHDQTRYIFETSTVGTDGEHALRVDDIVETANHFRCIDFIIDTATRPLSESYIKSLHALLKSGTSDSHKDWFAVGEYKKIPNEVGGRETVPPACVGEEIRALISVYASKKAATLEDIVAFHVRFEEIHPFQDGNGRVGRLLMLKECLKHGITPFIIDEEHKLFYYRGIKEWHTERGYLLDTCRSAQERFSAVLRYFKLA